jgi:hypothetical protein
MPSAEISTSAGMTVMYAPFLHRGCRALGPERKIDRVRKPLRHGERGRSLASRIIDHVIGYLIGNKKVAGWIYSDCMGVASNDTLADCTLRSTRPRRVNDYICTVGSLAV